MGIKNVGNPDASFRGKFQQTTQWRPSFTPTPPGSAAPTPPSPAPISASGGTTFTADGYSYHAFESNGTFTVSSGGPMEIEYFLVGEVEVDLIEELVRAAEVPEVFLPTCRWAQQHLMLDMLD